GMGSLATIGVQRPPNLSVVVIDNERYGETGMQATHTASGVDLAKVAQACGFRAAKMVRSLTQVTALRRAIHAARGPVFAQVKVRAEKLPLVLPPRDGGLLKSRFRKALLGEGADRDERGCQASDRQGGSRGGAVSNRVYRPGETACSIKN